jgi:hypothetical protein
MKVYKPAHIIAVSESKNVREVLRKKTYNQSITGRGDKDACVLEHDFLSITIHFTPIGNLVKLPIMSI